jgi:acyl-CoA reductase-like NAD-dependent aldehyde dehydrogenase
VQALKNYIDGAWTASSSAERTEVMNPSTGEPIAWCPTSTAAEVDDAIAAARRAFPGWSGAPVTESGGAAADFARRANVGQVGINVGTPAPIAFYPVGGRKASFFGTLRGRANDAVDFYMDKKVVSTWHGR